MKSIPHLKMLVAEKSNNIDRKVKICLENEKEVLDKFIEEIKGKKVNYNTFRRQVYRLD